MEDTLLVIAASCGFVVLVSLVFGPISDAVIDAIKGMW